MQKSDEITGLDGINVFQLTSGWLSIEQKSADSAHSAGE
jgi:hypothetical protein